MRKSRFTGEQMVKILREADAAPDAKQLKVLEAGQLSMQGRWKVELVPLATGGIVMVGDGSMAVGEAVKHAFTAWSAVARGRG